MIKAYSPQDCRGIRILSIQSVPVSFGLWDTALKFLSPVPRSDVTDHLVVSLHSLKSDVYYICSALISPHGLKDEVIIKCVARLFRLIA